MATKDRIQTKKNTTVANKNLVMMHIFGDDEVSVIERFNGASSEQFSQRWMFSSTQLLYIAGVG